MAGVLLIGPNAGTDNPLVFADEDGARDAGPVATFMPADLYLAPLSEPPSAPGSGDASALLVRKGDHGRAALGLRSGKGSRDSGLGGAGVRKPTRQLRSRGSS